MQTAANRSILSFKATPFKIKTWLIVRLPEKISLKLPSRGLVMAKVTLSQTSFIIPLEPDGRGSHWFKIDHSLQKTALLRQSVPLKIDLELVTDWPRPKLPPDFKQLIESSSKASELWQQLTPKAQWEWLRYTRSIANQDMRPRRLELAVSKMESGKRRPCCWNQNLCSSQKYRKAACYFTRPKLGYHDYDKAVF